MKTDENNAEGESVLPVYTASAKAALRRAEALSETVFPSDTGTGHLLLALMETESADGVPCTAAVLLSRYLTAERTRLLLSSCAEQTRTSAEDTASENASASSPDSIKRRCTPAFRRVLETAEKEAAHFPTASAFGGQNMTEVGTEHLLFALLFENDTLSSYLLSAQNVRQNELYSEVLAYLSSLSSVTEDADGMVPDEKSDTPDEVLSRFGRDLTALAKSGKIDPVAGREEETARVIRILLRRQKNNPVLLGDPGVGKTAVVEGLAVRIAEGTVPAGLRNCRIFALDLGALVAGAKYRGEFEERLRSVLSVCESAPDILLFLDELHTLMGAGNAEGALDCANLLKPALSRGTLRLIGATTQEEYRKTVARDGAMERRFQPVLIDEPDAPRAFSILKALRPKYEAHHGVNLPDETLRAAITLSVRYLPDRRLPDKALDLLDEASAMRRLGAERHTQPISAADLRGEAFLETLLSSGGISAPQTPMEPLTVTPAHLASVLTGQTGIPIPESAGEQALPPDFETVLRKRILGQDEAVSAVLSAVRRQVTGLRDVHRPAASFLFAGPTGVGKTALCKALAEGLFGTEERLLRFDMSEYAEAHTVSRLTGAPPGYIGYGDGGLLTEPVRRRPYSVVCFDEAEKAHPAVLRLLLQILEEGELTDSVGVRVSFRSAVIVLTTNAGSGETAHRTVGFSASGHTESANDNTELRSVFSAELLNRLDAVIQFHPLDRTALLSITRQMLSASAERAAEQEIFLSFSDDFAEWLLTRATETGLGARPIRRIIARELETPLSEGILNGSILHGDRILVSPVENGVCFEK